MTGIIADWMYQITDIRANQDTITLFFDKGSKTYSSNVYAIIIRDSCMQNVLISDLVIGDKLIEVYE